MHAWQVGDECWALFYKLAINDNETRLFGHVVGVGKDGFTVRMVKPDHEGKLIRRCPHYSQMWPSRELAEEWIKANSFNTGRVER